MPPNMKSISKRGRKLERKKLEIEKKRLDFLEYLHKEIQYGNVTRRRYERRWKNMLSKLALEQKRSDLEYTGQVCEWAIDVRDFLISAHMDELKKAEDQKASALENHYARIEMFTRQYKDALKSLHDDYLKTLDDMKGYYKTQDEELKNIFDNEQKTIGSMLFQIEQNNEEYTREQMAQYFVEIESCVNYATHLTQQIETNFDKKIKKIFTKCNESFDEYYVSNKRKINKYQRGLEGYDESKKKNDRNLRRIVYLVDFAKILQAKLEFLSNTHGHELSNLTDDIDKLRKILSTLGNKISSDIELDDTQMKLLVSCSITTLDDLNRILKKGEIVLKMVRCSQNYETLHEKVLPYPSGNINKKEMMNSEMKLVLFQFRMKNVDASRMALNEEKKFLQMKILRLRKNLEMHCSGFLNCTSKIRKSKPVVKQQKTRGNLFYRCRIFKEKYDNSGLNLDRTLLTSRTSKTLELMNKDLKKDSRN